MSLVSDVLIAPHHGSKTSSTADFLAKVRPSYVLISAGKANPYGHPHKKNTARLLEARQPLVQHGKARSDTSSI